MPLTAEQRRARARLAANVRHHPDSVDLRMHDLAAFYALSGPAHIDHCIDELAAAAAVTEMSPEQRARVAKLGT